MGLISPRGHITKIYFKEPSFLNITPSGIKILNYYPAVSKYGTDSRWVTNPQSLNTQGLADLLNNIE